jgi:hypothetical protein
MLLSKIMSFFRKQHVAKPLTDISTMIKTGHYIGRYGKPMYREDYPDGPYQCAVCGWHDLVVEKLVSQSYFDIYVLPCQCEQQEEFAARESLHMNKISHIFDLKPDHELGKETTWARYSDENIEELDEYEIFCEFCEAKVPDSDWYEDEDSGPQEPEPTEGDLHVFCAKCGHEIEFGYVRDNPNQFWPCESKDFDPGKVVPDKKYEELWDKRGWIRPSKEE